METPLYSDVISTTAASAQSSVIPPYVRHAMLTSTTACFVAYGSDPTAAAGAGSFYLPGGETIHLTVTPGQKFAAIRAVDNGRLSIVGVSGGQALTYTSESSWTPADLFASGEEGGWYDPSDLSTMFQLTTGTTAVAANDPVGILLDKRLGLVRGAEEVSNGDFSDGATGWVPNLGGNSGWSIGGGVATYSGTTNSNIGTSTNIAISGRWYEVRFDIVSGSGINIAAYIASQVDLSQGLFVNVGVGSYRAIVLAPSTGALILRRQAGTDFSIDNVSLRELPGNHLTQANAARRPVLRESGGLYYLEFDGTDDVLFGTLTTQIVAPWDFWLAANITTGGGVDLGFFSKSNDPTSLSTSLGVEGIFQRSDVVQRLLSASRIGSGTAYSVPRNSAFTINSPFFVRCSAETGPDQLRVTTASGSDAAAAVYTGTPGTSAYRIGHQGAGCQWRFFNGIAVDRVLSSSEATDLQAYIEAKAGI